MSMSEGPSRLGGVKGAGSVLVSARRWLQVHSIERRLLVWILGALSIGAAVLVGVSYLVTLDEMDEIFDESLKQVVLAAASASNPA
jgi:hypothetical protein